MSARAKEVLIKCQAILTYVMGVFKLPTMLCEEMTEDDQIFLVGRGRQVDESALACMGEASDAQVS
jgi:hypothetical protein